MTSEDKYCPACASPLVAEDAAGRTRPVCPRCGHVVYLDPKVAATCIVERDGSVLMIRRALQPGIGLWSIPGGYVDRGEVVESAAAREVLEETGLKVDLGGLIGLFSEPGNPVIVAVYAARETGGALGAGPEALEVGFFDVAQLPELAFPRDREVLAKWIDGAGKGG